MVSHVECTDGGVDAKPLATARLALVRLGPEVGQQMVGRAAGLGMLGSPAEWRAWETVSSGFTALDGLLPAGGVRRGSLIEWWAAGGADGAVAVACAVACRLARSRPGERSSASSGSATSASTIVVVDRGARFHPPAVLPWLACQSGLSAGVADSGAPEIVPEIVLVRPARDDDELWAIDQALRCPGVAAVLAWPGRMQANAMRRLQVAARASGAVGLLVRGQGGARPQSSRANMRDPTIHEPAIHEPTWAAARVAVAPIPRADGRSLTCTAERRLRLSLVGGPWQGEAMLEDRSVDICLDLTSGREIVGRRHAGESTALPRSEREERACRAS